MTLRLPPLPTLPLPAPAREPAREPPEPLRFGEFAITETRSFPPPSRPECWVYVTLNAEIALAAQACEGLRRLLSSTRVRVSVDGQWIWWALRRKYPRRPLAKLSGSDLIYELAAHCAAGQRRLLLLGASEASNAAAVNVLQQRWPGLQVAGLAMPAFEPGTASERASLALSLQAIRAHAADYVVLALGPAKQYRFAWALAGELDGLTSGLLCFGGAIDMVSGSVRRAPKAWQDRGLESIYRVLQQPSRARRWLGTLRILPRLALGRF